MSTKQLMVFLYHYQKMIIIRTNTKYRYSLCKRFQLMVRSILTIIDYFYILWFGEDLLNANKDMIYELMVVQFMYL
jgi:hypothetical protein